YIDENTLELNEASTTEEYPDNITFDTACDCIADKEYWDDTDPINVDTSVDSNDEYIDENTLELNEASTTEEYPDNITFDTACDCIADKEYWDDTDPINVDT
ncbi:MAG: hypothetical protein ACK559_39080, partial [bacterium]